jgi:hypothetical protein
LSIWEKNGRSGRSEGKVREGRKEVGGEKGE